jgi:hypothetical protein
LPDLERFVSTNGNDAPGNGASASKPYRTVQKAASDLSRSLAAGQIGKILVEPGLYEEVVVLTDNMQLLRSDSKEHVRLALDPESWIVLPDAVCVKRPPEASAPARNSSSPTWPEVVKVHGKNILIKGIQIEGDARPQRVVFIHDSENVTIQGCLIGGGKSKILYTGKGAGTKADPFRSAVTEEGEGAGARILRSKGVTIRNCMFRDNRTELKYEQAVKDNEIDILTSSARFQVAVKLRKIDEKEADKKLRQAQPVRNGGGHLSCYDADDIHVENCFFLRGFCGGRGGAVQLAHNAYASFVKCLFDENESGVDGGGIAFSDPDPMFFTRKPVTLTDCKFRRNQSGDDGGGAYFTTGAIVTLRNCVFQENRAASNGGGLRATYGTRMMLRNCTFTDNEANIDARSTLVRNQDGGGAIAVNNSTLDMDGGKIESNRVNGFAGGGIYFIVAAFNEAAEQVAKIIHDQTFEHILKQGYKVTESSLKMSNVAISFNRAEGETCYEDTCTLSPRTGFKAGGAGGALYVLGGPNEFGFPLTAFLENVSVVENLSAHRDDKQKSEMVFRNIDKLVLKGCTAVVQGSNKFALSLLSVKDADLTASPVLVSMRRAGAVFEEKSNVKS